MKKLEGLCSITVFGYLFSLFFEEKRDPMISP